MKLNCRPLAFTSYIAFSKNKNRPRASPTTSFSSLFFKKNIYFFKSHYLTKFHCLVALHEILGNMCPVIVCCPGCDVINFEIILFFPFKYFSLQWPNSQDKNLNILKTKRAFFDETKIFSYLFKGFSLKQLQQFFLEGESPTLFIIT